MRCIDCGKDKSKKGIYCKFCKNKHRPSGLIYKKHKDNPTSFKKGQSPWNKGLTIKDSRIKSYSAKLVLVNKGKHFSPKTEFTSETVSEQKNHNWKGDGVGYFALHQWVYRRLGKAMECEVCTSTVRVQWANKSGLYKRDLGDWLELCQKCHSRYDKQLGWGKIKERFINI